MKIRNLLFITISSMSLLLMNNDVFATSLEVRTTDDISDNISVNSERMELLPYVQENEEYNDGNNVQNIVLNVHDAKVKNNESFCPSFTTVIQGVLLIPMTIYGSIISNIVVNNNKNISSSNNEMIRIRSKSRDLVGNACDETITSFMKCIKIIGNKTINVGTNILSGTKSYVVRKIWG